jgi:hypothetical protein
MYISFIIGCCERIFIIDDIGIIFGIVNRIYPLGGILIAFWFITINNLKSLFIIFCLSVSIFNYYLHKIYIVQDGFIVKAEKWNV